MRLIDADALHDSIDTETYRHTYIEQIHSIIDNAPTIDAEPIVRCKDCKHNEGGTCGYSEFNIEVNDYCSFGERREP